MRSIDTWKEDFKGFVNSLNMPRDDYKGIMEYIDEVPSAQPERKKGKWKLIYECNCCGNMEEYERYFCPNCGADMRGYRDEND